MGWRERSQERYFPKLKFSTSQEKCEIALFAPLTDVYRGSAEPKMEFLRATFGFTNM